jgi:hypothetical protein
VKTRVFMLAAVCALAAPAAARAATVPVQQLNGDFAASNSTVIKTPDGVHFGTYADAGIIGGLLIYTGANGPLASLDEFAYTFTYRQATHTTGAAPYARVFIDDNPAVDADGDGVPNNDVDEDIILDPSMTGGTPAPAGTCPAVEPAQATDLTFSMSTHLVRLNDDLGADCANSVMTFAQAKAAVLAASPNAAVSSLNVTQGFSTGQDVSALVRRITVNGTTFAFDVPPAPGVVTQNTTVIQQVPVPAAAAPAAGVLAEQVTRTCRGATLRRIHAPARKGERFLRVNAALQTATGLRKLRVRGRTVTVDLRNRPEANYNVRLISRYRTKSGHVRRVVTRRNLSVACS